MKAVSTKLGVFNPLFTTEYAGGYLVFVHEWYTDGAFLRGAFSTAWRAYSLFSELSKARAFEASVRRGGSNKDGDLLHCRSRQKNFTHEF